MTKKWYTQHYNNIIVTSTIVKLKELYIAIIHPLEPWEQQKMVQYFVNERNIRCGKVPNKIKLKIMLKG